MLYVSCGPNVARFRQEKPIIATATFGGGARILMQAAEIYCRNRGLNWMVSPAPTLRRTILAVESLG